MDTHKNQFRQISIYWNGQKLGLAPITIRGDIQAVQFRSVNSEQPDPVGPKTKAIMEAISRDGAERVRGAARGGDRKKSRPCANIATVITRFGDSETPHSSHACGMGFCGVQKPAALMWPICGTRTILTTYTCGFSDLFVAHAVTAAFAGPPCRLGKSEVDGRPPFWCRIGTAMWRNLHLRSNLRGALPSQVSLAGRPGPWAWPTNDNADALERDSMKWRHAVLVLADAGAVIWRTRYDPRGGLGTHRALRGPIVRLASSLPCIIPPS